MQLVLFRFIESLLMSHHSLKFLRSKIICNSNDFKALAETNNLVSPANILIERTSQQLGLSKKLFHTYVDE